MLGKDFSIYDFGQRLADRRKACGYRSQSDLATAIVPLFDDSDEYEKRIESKRKSISNWESGKHEPSISDFALLCELLECDPEYLLGTIDVPQKATKSVMDVTGLDEKAVSKLQREIGNVRLHYLSKLILQKDFWEILNTFANLGGVSSEKSKENKRLSEMYWDIVKSGKDPDNVDLYQRVAMALDRSRYDYDLERYRCQILFKSIVDKFLPNRW